MALDENTLRRYIPNGWNSRRLSDISRADVARLHSKIGEDHGHYAANRTLALLRTMFNLAPDLALFKGENPAQGIKQFHEEKRERYLNPDELATVNRALLEEPDWRWRAYFPLALMLGTRKSELLAMRWTDIDMERRTWRIPQTRKDGNSHLLPLPGPVRGNPERAPVARQERSGFPRAMARIPGRRQRRTYRRARQGVAARSGARQCRRCADSRFASYPRKLARRARVQSTAHRTGSKPYADGDHGAIRSLGHRSGACSAGADRGPNDGG